MNFKIYIYYFVIKLFIIGASSKLARKFILSNSLKNVSILGTYHTNDIRKFLKIVAQKMSLSKIL